ncbi:amyloid-beta A4 precursor protein-binding family A member 2 isoform X2 [Tachysurus fulvidraco]|uniref:amyloid-beta A4 precursor protein-binding family A member 2 isoform X2 n=1 Tax=Tachysurus fulvidraco TaxID=1234273 RepID=UPI001FEE33A6|nr:amyloid-beta A4 precursor protein-binding family A member 2 isoform X2 [Tachysurus fulvidraco]
MSTVGIPLKPVMALRQSQGSGEVPDHTQCVSSLPEQTAKHFRDGGDPEEHHSSNTESQSSTPVPASFCPIDGSVSGEDFDHRDSFIHHDSMEEDSLSEYDNVGSEEEEEHDYEEDEELRTDADGMTYYVHCCPEDESYLEGIDCHVGTESNNRPSTSREPDTQGNSGDTWEFSEGFYEVIQQGTEELVHKCPEPITKSTFIQAPMAEDEEDEEEDADDVDEEDNDDDDDAVEEDETYFDYEQEKAGGNQDENVYKGQCDLEEDSKNPIQGSNYSNGLIRAEADLSRDYRVDKSIPEKCKGDAQRSLTGHRESNKKSNSEVKVDYSGNELGRVDKTSKPGSIFRGHQICKEDRGSRNCRLNAMTKPEDTENRDFKKRHSYRDDGREEREDRCSHVGSNSPEGSIGKGHGCPHSYRAKSRRDREWSVDTDKDMNQIVNEVKTKMNVGPQSTGTDRSIAKKSCDDKRISENSQVSLQKNQTSPRKEDNKGQATQSSPQHCTVNPQSETNTSASNHNQQGKRNHSFPSFVDVPGPCEPEDLIDGIIFAANYLGSTQLFSDRNPSKSVRMMQAQEAVDKVKCVDKESQSPIEVDLFISTKAIKVLNADTQETMVDDALRTISYIADIGSVVVLMARRRVSQSAALDCNETSLNSAEGRKQYRMICYVFESEDAQLIAQSIGQAFSMAYQEFLRANGINPKDLSQKDYSDILNSQEMYNDDLIHFSNSENCKELHLEKQKGEILGVVIVESGWGSILPTVILACMLNSGPAARSGKLNVGDQIMAVNDTSLVGLPLATCQGIIKGLKNQLQVKLSVVSCPPVTMVLIKRPDLQYPLGFSVQNGIICSLMRGGIAERGGVRVGHRIIEINGQSVVAMAHEKIVHALSVSVGEIHMKTMPAVMFRLLTGQETPMYI